MRPPWQNKILTSEQDAVPRRGSLLHSDSRSLPISVKLAARLDPGTMVDTPRYSSSVSGRWKLTVTLLPCSNKKEQISFQVARLTRTQSPLSQRRKERPRLNRNQGPLSLKRKERMRISRNQDPLRQGRRNGFPRKVVVSAHRAQLASGDNVPGTLAIRSLKGSACGMGIQRPVQKTREGRPEDHRAVRRR